MKKIFVLFLMFFVSLSMFSQQHIVEFNVKNKEEIKQLPNYVSVDYVKGNFVRAYLWGENFAKFQKLGYEFEEIKNPANSKVINMATTRAQMANWDRYPTYALYLEMMNYYASTYPNLCQLVTIGTSVEGRLLIALKISDNVSQHEQEPEYFYTSSMHGDELTGAIMLLRLTDWLLSNYNSNTDAAFIINNFELYINPLANPDGSYAGGNTTVSGSERYNANGTDLNRDFPYPGNLNSPYATETQAMMTFADNHNFVMSANFHGGAEVMNYPWDVWTSAENTHADDAWFYKVCRDYVIEARTIYPSYMTDVVSSGVTEGADWYYADGTRQDYMMYYQNCRETCIEISHDKLISSDDLPEFWSYNHQSLLGFIKEAIYGFNGTVKNENGDPLNAKIEIVGHDKDNSEVYTDVAFGDYYRPIYPGTYNVTYSSEGYISQTHSVTVTDWQTTTIKNVVLIQAAQVNLTGTVIDANTGNPVENARIRFLETSINDVFTNSDGQYSVTVYENIYNISVYKDGYAQQTTTKTIDINNSVVDFALLPVNAITFEVNIPGSISFSGNANWTRSNSDAYEGSYSMRSGVIDDDQNSTMTLSANTEAGTFSFYKKVSSESEFDFLTFYIDNVEKDTWSGSIDWSEHTYTIASGNHTFKWVYSKDGSSTGGSDCSWVDFIQLPAEAPASYSVTFTILEGTSPIQNAEINLVGYGSKTTNSNGNASFSTVFQSDNLSYTVSATNYLTEEGTISVNGNTNETVYLTPTSIDENNLKISIFPNPTVDILFVNSSINEGIISIIDLSGTEIISLNITKNQTEIDLSGLAKGIYFIKVSNLSVNYFEKIILK